MQKTLEVKLAALKKDPASPVFILADAKDADMAFGIAATGRNHDGKLRSVAEYRDQMRAIVSQGLVDIMLMSASNSEILAIQERIFDASAVTPGSARQRHHGYSYLSWLVLFPDSLAAVFVGYDRPHPGRQEPVH